MKNKKFIAIGLAVFLVSMAGGKYAQLTALTSADMVYATEVKNKKTGELVRYEIRRKKNGDFQVYNTATGEVYKANAETVKGNNVRIALPDQEGEIVIRKDPAPWSKPSVSLVNSNKYEQVKGTTTVTTSESEASSSTSSASSSSEIEKSSQTSSSSSSQSDTKTSTKSSSKKNSSSSSSESSTKSSSSASSSSSETEDVSLTKEDEKAIIRRFGQWLSGSDYGKNAVVVQGTYDEIVNIGATSTTFRTIKTKEDDILAQLIGSYSGDMASLPDTSIYVDGKKDATADDLINYKNSFAVTLLGNDLTSDQAEDFQSKAAFRLYTLKETEQKLYTSSEDERKELLDSKVPSDHTSGAENNGYDYYYKNLVNQDKDSYQIILATDGLVYYVKDYWIKKYDNSKAVYEKAPENMQKAYQELVKEYSEKSSTETSSAYPKEMLGTWEGEGQSAKQTLTYQVDGTAIHTTEGFATKTGNVGQMEKVSENLYRFVGGDFEAVFPGLGIGGAGFDAEFGVKLSGNTITYVEWTGEMNTEFNPNTYRYTELKTFTKKK